MSNFELRRERHAIAEFNATINFFKAIGQGTFVEGVEVVNRLAEELDLPAPMNMQVFTINLQGQSNGPEVSNGYGRQRFSSTGEVEMSLFYDTDSVQLTLRNYESWVKTLPLLVKCLSPLASVFIKDVPAAKSFSLRYNNEFRSKQSEMLPSHELLRPDSIWLPSFASTTSEAWHSHVGRAEALASNYRRVVNVNSASSFVMMGDISALRNLVSIQIQVSENYDIPGQKPLAISENSLEEVIASHLDQAHSREKQVLTEVISDSYLDLVGARS